MLRSALTLLAMSLFLAGGVHAADLPDEASLRTLNGECIHAFLSADVSRFRTLLSDDFSGVLADGRLIDRAEFLREAASPPDARDLKVREVTIRVYGDVALVGAVAAYARTNGAAVRTRYSSLYVRHAGQWKIAWLQWTRIAGP